MKKPRHAVTDHALLCYLERKQGIDIEALRLELGHRIDEATCGLEGANAVIIDGFRYAIEGDHRVTTVWPQNQGKPGPRPMRERPGSG